MRGKIAARWRRRWGEEGGGGGTGKNAAGMLGDDSTAYATAVIGSHHHAAIFAASPGSIQAVCVPVTSHQVGGGDGRGRGGNKRRQRQYERGRGNNWILLRQSSKSLVNGSAGKLAMVRVRALQSQSTFDKEKQSQPSRRHSDNSVGAIGPETIDWQGQGSRIVAHRRRAKCIEQHSSL